MTKKKRSISYEFSIYQGQRLERLAKTHQTSPQAIAMNIADIVQKFASLNNPDQVQQVLRAIKIKHLKQKLAKKIKDIEEIRHVNNIVSVKLKEYEEDYLAIVELGKALETLNKV
ncbi:MAG: hypothetical protein ACTSYD_04290 [Candidatus Heimdallarchaeaceae archaeon]